MAKYKYFQPNKKDTKDEHGDCIIRAICAVTGKPWLEVFDGLVAIAREKQDIIASVDVLDTYLKANGFKYHKRERKRNNKFYTIAEMTERRNGDILVMNAAHHEVGAVNGTFYDTWNSGYETCHGYYVKEE